MRREGSRWYEIHASKQDVTFAYQTQIFYFGISQDVDWRQVDPAKQLAGLSSQWLHTWAKEHGIRQLDTVPRFYNDDPPLGYLEICDSSLMPVE